MRQNPKKLPKSAYFVPNFGMYPNKYGRYKLLNLYQKRCQHSQRRGFSAQHARA